MWQERWPKAQWCWFDQKTARHYGCDPRAVVSIPPRRPRASEANCAQPCLSPVCQTIDRSSVPCLSICLTHLPQVEWLLGLSFIFPPAPQHQRCQPPGYERKLIVAVTARIEPQWIPFRITRYVQRFNGEAGGAGFEKFQGSADSVERRETDYLRGLRCKKLSKSFAPSEVHDQDEEAKRVKQDNFKALQRMPQVYHAFMRRWENEHQVEIKLNTHTGEFNVEHARAHIEAAISNELDKHKMMLEQAAVVSKPDYEPRDRHPPSAFPSAFVSFDFLIGQPKRPLANYTDAKGRTRTIDNVDDITRRVEKVTDPQRSATDLWRAVHSKGATRETRMEAVAWVAVTKHGMRLEGGFIRDWVVAGQAGVRRPPTNVDWVTGKGKPGGDWKDRPEVHAGLGPQDLDLQLPIRAPKGGWFDVERFVREVQELGISVDMVHQDSFLRCLLFDADVDRCGTRFGPFLADLIEPHQVATHDQLDFDVNNLFVIAGHKNEIGMKVPVPEFSLSSIIANIQQKKIVVAKPRDHKIQQRIDKMRGRGWTINGDAKDDCIFTPNRGFEAEPVFLDVPRTDVEYRRLKAEIESSTGAVVRRIQRISSLGLETLYQSQRAMIMRETKAHGLNEKFVWHGTNADNVLAIARSGFDDHFYDKKGAFGRGESLSHASTEDVLPGSQRTITRIEIVCIPRALMFFLFLCAQARTSRPTCASPSDFQGWAKVGSYSTVKSYAAAKKS